MFQAIGRVAGVNETLPGLTGKRYRLSVLYGCRSWRGRERQRERTRIGLFFAGKLHLHCCVTAQECANRERPGRLIQNSGHYARTVIISNIL